MLCVVWSW